MQLDRWTWRHYAEDMVDVYLGAGEHDLRLDYYEIDGYAKLKFNYQPVSNLSISYPENGTTFIKGKTYPIKFTCEKGIDKSLSAFYVDERTGYSNLILTDLTCSADGATVSRNWTVPQGIRSGQLTFKIVIKDDDSSVFGESLGHFSITK